MKFSANEIGEQILNYDYKRKKVEIVVIAFVNYIYKRITYISYFLFNNLIIA